MLPQREAECPHDYPVMRSARRRPDLVIIAGRDAFFVRATGSGRIASGSGQRQAANGKRSDVWAGGHFPSRPGFVCRGPLLCQMRTTVAGERQGPATGPRHG